MLINARVPLNDKETFLKLAVFDKECIVKLNDILDKFRDIEIVISSDWSHRLTLFEMQEMYREYGIIKIPIDVIKYDKRNDYRSTAEMRSSLIKQWLIENTVEPKTIISDWVAIDDLDMRLLLQYDNFIYVEQGGFSNSRALNKLTKIWSSIH